MTREEAIQELEETNTILKSWGGFTEYPQALYIAIEMAIEALQDRPKGDWIPCSERLPEAPTFCLVTTDGSYNDVIDIALYMSDGWHKASKVLAWMPLPKPYKGSDDEREWIPCSERLPKEKQEVYVTVYFTEGDTGRAYGYIDGFGKWHLCSTVEGTLNSGYEVLAWMPLPKPYKGGENK